MVSACRAAQLRPALARLRELLMMVSVLNELGRERCSIFLVENTAKRHRRGARIRSYTEVTVTSGQHAQAEGTKKLKREGKAASSGGADKDPEPEDGA